MSATSLVVSRALVGIEVIPLSLEGYPQDLGGLFRSQLGFDRLAVAHLIPR